MIRLLAVSTAVSALCGCASIPQDEGRPLSDGEDRTTVSADGSMGIEVCELVGRDSIVRVLTSQTGTRYTLCRLDGSTVAADLDAKELARLRPDLDPAAMQADWGQGPLMMLDVRE